MNERMSEQLEKNVQSPGQASSQVLNRVFVSTLEHFCVCLAINYHNKNNIVCSQTSTCHSPHYGNTQKNGEMVELFLLLKQTHFLKNLSCIPGGSSHDAQSVSMATTMDEEQS